MMPPGNVMGIYKREDEKANPNDANDTVYTATFSITERPIYGSDRVGQDVFEEVVYTRTYGFDGIEQYQEIAVDFSSSITNALGNVLLVQNNNQELTDVNGGTIQIEATTIAKAKANKAFNALQYEPQQDNAAVLPIHSGNNVILIEDSQGEVISYGLVARNYFSADPDRSVLLLYDTQGALIPGLELINDDSLTPIDAQAKTVVVRHPSNPTEYLLFYRDRAAGLHCATLRNSGGLTITKHENFAYSNYGRHMAVIQDELQKKAYLYATMHSAAVIEDGGTISTPAGINLVRFTIDQAGAVTFDGALLPAYFDSFDSEGNGELQIALNGSAISIYHNTSLPEQWTDNAAAEIRTWQLDAETRLPEVTSVVITPVVNGNIGKGSLINTGDEIYYTQYTQEVSSSTDNKVVKQASNGAVVATGGFGDLRINKDDKLYQFVSTTDSGQEWNLDTRTVTALNNLPASTAGSTGYQPYQAYTILKAVEEATDGIVYRNIGHKYYEIKDHLGNVRTVVGDRKNADPATGDLTANVESYNNYYAFGMLQPGRHKDSKSYRYGFQGQEKDDEIKGEGNSINYKFRMHDPRVGRFFAVDPLASKYPHNSPYAFSENRVIDAVELEGLEAENIHANAIVTRYGVDALKIKTVDDAFGNVQTQLFTLKVLGNHQEFSNLKETFLKSPQTITNNPLAIYFPAQMKGDKISMGDEIAIKPTAPILFAFVRVMNVEDKTNSFSATFATLYGHPEAGYVKFFGSFDEETGEVSFDVLTETRESFGLSKIGPSRIMQVKQWEIVMGTVREFLNKTEEETTVTKKIEKFEYDPKGSMGKGKLIESEEGEID
ncbi:DUF1990 family protein [Lacinutrix neustonica]|uniref:DUF1990 family protein n=1 Tax=Lacinutrix neustonica TaxID=2980107 RepID=A0A9E8MW56_9FLAO|nr:DUF1990 family protein [Lacinutrix neustonica]WAC02722.1 DUF1990 family protein [Lacinutrix neustonica]